MIRHSAIVAAAAIIVVAALIMVALSVDMEDSAPSGNTGGPSTSSDAEVLRSRGAERLAVAEVGSRGDAGSHPSDSGEWRGAIVRGRVADEDGVGVAGAQVFLEGLGGGATSTGMDGQFTLPDRVPAGRALLQVKGRGFVLTDPASSLLVDQGIEEINLHVSVRRLPVISGNVQTREGRPVAGYGVGSDRRVFGKSVRATTRQDGSFELYAPEAETPDPIRIVTTKNGQFGLLDEIGPVEWGTRGLVLTTGPGLHIRTLVKRLDDGSPVEQYSVFVLHDEYQRVLGYPSNRGVEIRSSDGVGLISVLPGSMSLLVVPGVAGLSPSDGVRVAISDDRLITDLSIVLAPARTIRVLVTQDGDGSPIAGARVSARVVGTRAEIRSFDGRFPRAVRRGGERVLEMPGMGVIDQVTTDGSGHALLTTAVAVGSTVELSASASGFVASKLSVVLPLQSVAISLSQAASIQASISPEAMLQYAPKLRFVPVIEEEASRPRWYDADVRSGHVVVNDLRPGRTRVELGITVDGGPIMITDRLGEVDLTEGENQLEFDVSGFMPGRIVGTALVDGRVPEKVRLRRVVDGEIHHGWIAEAICGSDGRFEFGVVPPGTFAVSALPNSVPVVIGVVDGVVSDTTFEISGPVFTRNVDVVILDSTGSPVPAGELFWVTFDDPSLSIRSQQSTVMDGRLVLSSVPTSARIRVEAVAGPRRGMHGFEATVGAPRILLQR